MRQLYIFVWKEARHILRDVRTLLILIVLPVILVLLFGFAISTEVNNASFVMLDPEGSPESHRLAARMEATGYFRLVGWYPSRTDVEQAFREAKAKMAVVIPPDFMKDGYRQQPQTVQFLADASDPNTATTLVNYASAVLRRFQQEEWDMAGGERTLQVFTQTKMLYNPRLESVYMFVPGVLTVILTLVSALMTSISLTREKENGNIELLLVSPLRPSLIIIGKVLPYLVLGLLIMGLTLLMATTVFGMPVAGAWWLLGLECTLYIFTCLSLGVLISTRVNTQQVAMLISMIALMLPVMLLSGFIFPIESMPQILQWLSHIIPAKWFIIILKSVMLKGNGLENVWLETSVLLGMTAALLAVSMRNFKIRLS